MKPHPRIRKTIKWSGAAASLLLLVAWIGSGFRYLGYVTSNGYGVEVSAGWMWLSRDKALPPKRVGPLSVHPARFHLFGWWFERYDTSAECGVAVPVWLMGACALVPTIVAWRSDARANRRERAGKCPKCRYDRAGLATHAVCPECGTPPKGG